MRKMAVLLSGSGRTLDNFHEWIVAGTLRAQIQVVVSNVASALGLEKAKRYGYPAFFAGNNEAINEILAGDFLGAAAHMREHLDKSRREKLAQNLFTASDT